MNITTLNLAGYLHWNECETDIISFLNTSHSDVVFLQEVKLDTAYAPMPQSVYLNAKLETPYPHSQSAVSRFYQSSDGSQQREARTFKICILEIAQKLYYSPKYAHNAT